MRVLIDMDGVIADFEGGFLKQWRLQHPDKLYIPLEKRNTSFILDQYPSEYGELIREILGATGYFRSLEPVAGSIEALTKMSEAGIEVFICTSPRDQYENCVLEKYEWVDRHIGREWTRQIILTKDKTIIKADFLIDDKPELKGADTPSWEHIIYDLPENRSDQKKRRLSWENWEEVMLSDDRFKRAYRDQE